jgi:hypothetical protein
VIGGNCGCRSGGNEHALMVLRRTIHILFSIFVFAFLPVSSHANTLIVVLRAVDTAFIGADSEISLPQGTEFGKTCKIHITNDLVWATAGLVLETRGPFNVYAQAETAIRDGGTLDEIATRFELRIIDQLKEMLPRYRATDPNNYYRTIKGGLNAIISVVFFKQTDLATRDFFVLDKDAPLDIQIVRHRCPGNCPVSGNAQVLIGDHEAADAELVRIGQDFWGQKGIVGGMNYLVETQHLATPNSVDAPTSILRIDKNGTMTWMQKGLCQ